MAPKAQSSQALTKADEYRGKVLASVTDIKPEWRELAQAISLHYREQRIEQATSPHLGRISLLADTDAVASILAGLDAGSRTAQQAAMAIGISADVITRCLKHGEQDDREGRESAHAHFYRAVQIARERKRQRTLSTIEAASLAGPQYWTAAAWIGERDFGEDYKLTAQQVSGGVTVNIGVISPGDIKVGIGLPEGESHAPSTPSPTVIDVTPIDAST